VHKSQSSHRLLPVFFWAAAFLTVAAQGAAEDANPQPSGADDLFRRGKERLALNDYAAGCPLLAESYRLDPATGSLLALALCHERQGKLASALREYDEVVARSRSEGRSDRVQAAEAQIAALKSRLSTLTLLSEQPASELAIHVNDTPVAPEQVGHPLPVDGGLVLVEVEAEGRLPWQKHFTIAESGQTLSLTIPTLVPRVVAPPPTPTRHVPVVRPSPKPAPRSFNGAEIAGITLMSAGGVSAILAAGFTVQAVRKNNQSETDCIDDLCTPEGRETRLDARRAGDIATISVITATTLGATGLISYLVGRSRGNDVRRARSASVRASGWIAAQGAGAGVTGGF
jgi:hypothetical protein